MTAKQNLLNIANHRGWTITYLLNYLQEYGQISDNIIEWKELPECEAARVLPWIDEFVPGKTD